jgi:arginyl-tRNA synthetase
MKDMQAQIEARLREAVRTALGHEHADADPLVTPATNPKFGDYQANLAMGLAKRLGAKPRDLAEKIVGALALGEPIARAEIAGPGFINLTLAEAALAAHADAMLADERLGVPAPAAPQRIVVDYSAPNVAKEMHVGHLRSTIIGDAIARVLGFLGHAVIRQNHVGDWGTQFGMLIENLIDRGFDPDRDASAGELTAIYKASKQRFDAEPDFAERARQRVVKLQRGDEQTLAVWRALVEQSKHYFQSVYDRLGVELQPDDVRGESFYNDRLEGIVNRLDSEGHLRISEGAAVVYPEGFTGKDGEKMPMIVRKSDGGYLYATTDLAAAMFRVHDLGATRVIYVIGLPQRQHVAMFTQTLRQAGWIDEDVRIDFVGFGSVLGPDRKMFKTRSGETVRLVDLIDEAEQRAAAVITEKNPDLSPEDKAKVAKVVGIGALKYADLSNDRVKDYIFDWDRMLALEGNTAPYMIYSYVRVRSIFRKGDVSPDVAAKHAIAVREDAERQLMLQLVQFPQVVEAVAESLEPHR